MLRDAVVSLPSRSRRRSGVRRTSVASSRTTVLKVGHNAAGDHLVEAADKLAEGIRGAAAAIPSRKIPPSVDVRPAGKDLVFVVATAPNAYPIETGARHPLFGLTGNAKDRRLREGIEFTVRKSAGRSRTYVGKKELVGHWYPMKRIPFMEQGIAAGIDDAADIYAQTVDDWLKEVGWE